MRGVLFLDRPLQAVDGFRYFEVCLEVVYEGEQDGLTLGVTTRLPQVPALSGCRPCEACPGCADDVDLSWSLGYDGRAHIHGASDLVLTCWNPKDLQIGDRVGFLVAGDGAACVLVNDARVVNLPGLVPAHEALYGVIDLLGNAKGVTLVDVSLPPENVLDFCLQTVRDEALDAMYSALSSGSGELIKAAVLSATHVGIDEAIIRQTERVVRAMPCYQPPPKGPPPPRPGQGSSTIVAPVKPGKKCTSARDDKTSARGDNSSRHRHLKPILESDSSVIANRSRLDNSGPSFVKAKGLEPSLLPHQRADTSAGACQKRDAEKALVEAWTSGSMNDFREALHRAEGANVPATVIAKAQGCLQEMERRSIAEQSLVDALAVGGLNSIEMALSNAIAAKVDPNAIAKARERMEVLQLERQRHAEKELFESLESGNLMVIKAALSQAELAHVEPCVLATYHKRVQDMERRAEAEQLLADSVATGDIKSLRIALCQAEVASVEIGDAITKAQRRLNTLESECRVEAENGISSALLSGDVNELRAALHKAVTSNIDPAMVAKAQQHLQELERRNEAERMLTETLASCDFNRIRLALNEARAASVDPDMIAKSQARLQELERRGEAARALADALDAGDLESLRFCVSDAVAAKVHPDLVARAKRRLEELERKVEDAWKLLEDAMAGACSETPPTVDKLALLDAAIATVADAGCAVDSVRALAARLKADMNVAAKEAVQTLQQALSSRDVMLIQKCLPMCRSLGAEQPVAEALSAVASLLRADLDKVRHLEREERRDMLPNMELLLGILREHLHPDLRKLHNDMQDMKGAVRVFCRVRPLIARELITNDMVAVTSPNEFTVNITSMKHEPKKTAVEACDAFNYDTVFTESSSQAEVFSECRSLIQSAFDGYNITIFTYGQTGAGKTWTLYGSSEHPGISPRTCDEVFDIIERDREKFHVTVSASMVELYNNTVCDLLSYQRVPPKIDIRTRRKEDGTEVVRLDCSEVDVQSAAELRNAVEMGFRQRKVACTTMNADSSRSHLLFMIKLVVTDCTTGRCMHGKITIVDLAGSERISRSNVTGDVKKEAIEINKSLTALGDVMSAITSGAKVVPYRNHKLTMLMQDSLGGTAKTLMFVNISPSILNADESVSALRYASRARCIENDVTSHVCPTSKDSPRRPRRSYLSRSFSGAVLRASSPPSTSPRGSSPRPGRASSPRAGLNSSPRISRMYSLPSFSQSVPRNIAMPAR